MTQEQLVKIFEGIRHGDHFEGLRLLQEGLDRKGRLSKYYVNDERCYYAYIWGDIWGVKWKMRKARQELIDMIVEHINKNAYLSEDERMPADHYARYIHALTILRADKSRLRSSKDLFHKAYLQLGELDDGSKETWEILESITWNLSEAIKVLKGTNSWYKGNPAPSE